MSDVISTISHDEKDQIFYENKPMKMLNDAHAGWVWDLAPDYSDCTTTVYSASWDNSVKAWDLNTFECLDMFRLASLIF